MIENRIAVLMAERRLKPRDVIAGTGLHQNTVSRLINNRVANIRLSTLNILCDYFKVTPNSIFKYTEDEDTNSYDQISLQKFVVSKGENE